VWREMQLLAGALLVRNTSGGPVLIEEPPLEFIKCLVCNGNCMFDEEPSEVTNPDTPAECVVYLKAKSRKDSLCFLRNGPSGSE
jgi:hypothetical protein